MASLYNYNTKCWPPACQKVTFSSPTPGISSDCNILCLERWLVKNWAWVNLWVFGVKVLLVLPTFLSSVLVAFGHSVIRSVNYNFNGFDHPIKLFRWYLYVLLHSSICQWRLITESAWIIFRSVHLYFSKIPRQNYSSSKPGAYMGSS